MKAAQVLDELEFLATVEHALIVEFLSIQCALGHKLEPDEGGATTDQGRAAADQAGNLAVVSMFRLKGINTGLVVAGRSARLDRATGIPDPSGGEISLVPPTTVQLQTLLRRAEAIAAAIAGRYAELRPAVTTHPVFNPELSEKLRPIVVEDGATHVASLDDLRAVLSGAEPATLLRVTRREPNDSFEQRLLDLSDHCYSQVLATLRSQFDQPDFFVSGSFRALATSAMLGELDISLQTLAQRGLLPAFSTP
jgi:hypothetical protein